MGYRGPHLLSRSPAETSIRRLSNAVGFTRLSAFSGPKAKDRVEIGFGSATGRTPERRSEGRSPPITIPWIFSLKYTMRVEGGNTRLQPLTPSCAVVAFGHSVAEGSGIRFSDRPWQMAPRSVITFSVRRVSPSAVSARTPASVSGRTSPEPYFDGHYPLAKMCTAEWRRSRTRPSTSEMQLSK
jgi:hypothetical protein